MSCSIRAGQPREHGSGTIIARIARLQEVPHWLDAPVTWALFDLPCESPVSLDGGAGVRRFSVVLRFSSGSSGLVHGKLLTNVPPEHTGYEKDDQPHRSG